MNKLIVFSLIFVLLVSGCSFEAEVLTPLPADQIVPPVIATTLAPAVTEPATPAVDFTPGAAGPIFYAASFTLDQNEVPAQFTFPAGTEEVFAHWHYHGMRNGMLISREWYLNGELWLKREEAWNEAKYGVAGIMPDVSIYDLDVGLPSGIYQLRLYIDGIPQPIGAMVNGQPEMWARFEILPDDSETGIPSPNGQWELFLSNGTLLFMQDARGERFDLYGGVHIVARAWMPDSRHVLFVDHNPNGQPVGPAGSLPGTLHIVDSQTLEVQILYSSETVLGEAAGGLFVSPDGKFAASIEGTGYGDACFLDSKLILFEIADDYQSVTVIRQEQFNGLPSADNGVVYPVAAGEWKNDTQFSIPMKGTCEIDPSTAGLYIFDLTNLTAVMQPGTSPSSVAGNLGWGQIHGVVTDATTGQPIANALVTCEHNSYTTEINMLCAGGIYTDVNGAFVYPRIFFHDTDTIKLTVTAQGYQSQDYTQNSFTTNDLSVNFPLLPAP